MIYPKKEKGSLLHGLRIENVQGSGAMCLRALVPNMLSGWFVDLVELIFNEWHGMCAR